MGEMRHYNLPESLSSSPWYIMCPPQINTAQKLELIQTMPFFIELVHILASPQSLQHSFSCFILTVSLDICISINYKPIFIYIVLYLDFLHQHHSFKILYVYIWHIYIYICICMWQNHWVIVIHCHCCIVLPWMIDCIMTHVFTILLVTI